MVVHTAYIFKAEEQAKEAAGKIKPAVSGLNFVQNQLVFLSINSILNRIVNKLKFILTLDLFDSDVLLHLKLFSWIYAISFSGHKSNL